MTRSFPLAIAFTLLAAAPQTVWADAQPGLIQCNGIGAKWKVTKTSGPEGGKCRIFTQEPKYRLNNVTDKDDSPYCEELKKADASYEFQAGTLGTPRNYWIVFFPKDRNLDVTLVLEKGDIGLKKTIRVTGNYWMTRWSEGPKVDVSVSSEGARKMSTVNSDNLLEAIKSKGKKVFLTLN